MDYDERQAAWAAARAEAYEVSLAKHTTAPQAASAPQTSKEIERLVDRRVAAALAERDEIWREVIGQLVASERKRSRAEVAKALTERTGSNELFYLDENGKKQDRELHNAIIGPVDHPIDERIMAPIRARHRAKYLAEQRSQRRAG
ncbi:hypothetical protein [Bradyrhizobium iriomotense]|uniref:hypothetical protein n=1 Tax=Bradyrhizobium iriomotense TaxID=441950 RepID=UPI001B8A254E|nr:hypothetical protein [Bradyrhizobium iriomotense]MBR0787388.1 hypothetical protein [Bradyrhizobium iriomotense]